MGCLLLYVLGEGDILTPGIGREARWPLFAAEDNFLDEVLSLERKWYDGVVIDFLAGMLVFVE